MPTVPGGGGRFFLSRLAWWSGSAGSRQRQGVSKMGEHEPEEWDNMTDD